VYKPPALGEQLVPNFKRTGEERKMWLGDALAACADGDRKLSRMSSQTCIQSANTDVHRDIILSNGLGRINDFWQALGSSAIFPSAVREAPEIA
jgi:hypothetical protein